MRSSTFFWLGVMPSRSRAAAPRSAYDVADSDSIASMAAPRGPNDFADAVAQLLGSRALVDRNRQVPADGRLIRHRAIRLQIEHLSRDARIGGA